MESKPKRKTRERALATSLELFNQAGEPNVTLAAIADEMDISQGNLYYHFKDKAAIVNALFDQYRDEMEGILAIPDDRPADVEDLWLFLHLLFERIWRHRFLYRDLADILSRYPYVGLQFKRVLGASARVIADLCEGLQAGGAMSASKLEVQTLAVNMTVIATYWLSFQYVRNPVGSSVAELGSCVQQVMALIAPYLQGDAKALLQRLSAHYAV